MSRNRRSGANITSQASMSDEDDHYQITTSYRAAFGGPRGMDATSWTASSSEQQVSASQSMSAAKSMSQTLPDSAQEGAPYDSAAALHYGDTTEAISKLADIPESPLPSNPPSIQGGATVVDDGETDYTVSPIPSLNSSISRQSGVADVTNQLEAMAVQDTSTSAVSSSQPPVDQSAGVPNSAAWARLEAQEQTADTTTVDTVSTNSSQQYYSQILLPGGVVAAPSTGNDDEDPAAHEAAVLLSKIATSSKSEQKRASNKLLQSIKVNGDQVRRATHAAGGITILQTMLNHKDPELRDNSMALMAEMLTLPEAREELASAPVTAGHVVGMACKGVANGQIPASQLLAAVADTDQGTSASGGSSNTVFMAACAQHKAMRLLIDATFDTSKPEAARTGALDALQAMCSVDPDASYRKLAWAGALARLVSMLDDAQRWRAASRLLLDALTRDKSLAESLCDESIIVSLSKFIASAEHPIQLQGTAAYILSCIAQVPLRKEEITRALVDHALPRACEVVREGGITVQYIVKSCAEFIGHLASDSEVCCHVIIFHTAVLKPVLAVLISSKQYVLAQELVVASSTYASKPSMTF